MLRGCRWSRCIGTASAGTDGPSPNSANPRKDPQAAYRVGHSTTNIIMLLMPHFPLVVVLCPALREEHRNRYGGAMMLPCSVSILIAWSAFVVLYWNIGIPLGLRAAHVYP